MYVTTTKFLRAMSSGNHRSEIFSHGPCTCYCQIALTLSELKKCSKHARSTIVYSSQNQLFKQILSFRFKMRKSINLTKSTYNKLNQEFYSEKADPDLVLLHCHTHTEVHMTVCSNKNHLQLTGHVATSSCRTFFTPIITKQRTPAVIGGYCKWFWRCFFGINHYVCKN
jgi:hypothetical protein